MELSELKNRLNALFIEVEKSGFLVHHIKTEWLSPTNPIDPSEVDVMLIDGVFIPQRNGESNAKSH